MGSSLLHCAEDPEATAGEKAFETARAGEQQEWLVNEWIGIPQSSWSREVAASISSGHLMSPSVIWDGVTVLAILLKKVILFLPYIHEIYMNEWVCACVHAHTHNFRIQGMKEYIV